MLRTILFLAVTLSALTLAGAQTKVDFAKAENRRPQSRLSVNRQAGFRRVLDQKNQVTTLEAQLKSREVDAITKDQARLRENMKALKGSSEERRCCNVTRANSTHRKTASIL